MRETSMTFGQVSLSLGLFCSISKAYSKGFLAKCFSACYKLLFLPWQSWPPQLTFSGLYCLLNLPPWTVTTRIPSQTYNLTPPSTTGFNQFSSVNIRKQTLLHFQRDPGKCARYKERNACLPEGPPTPTPAWTVNKINFTSKGCE